MEFKSGTELMDRGGQRRWKIVKRIDRGQQHAVWSVVDLAANMAKREMSLLTLNYRGIPERDRNLHVGTLRESFHRVAKILCGNFTFLPEPVDLIEFHNDQDTMEPGLRSRDPGLVLVAGEGDEPWLFDTSAKQLQYFRNTILAPCVKILHQLHNGHIVLRELRPATVCINPVTKRPFFNGFKTLIPMDDFHGYNPNHMALQPDPVYSAPECFSPNGSLTPATDVYVLGKFALALFMGPKQFASYVTQANPFPPDLQNRINDLNLPNPWGRWLSTCLQANPARRFQNMIETEIFFMPPEQQARIREDQRRQQTERQKPRSKGPAIGSGGRATAGMRPNPQLPVALMIVWNEQLTDPNESLEYSKLLQHYSRILQLPERLFFMRRPAYAEQWAKSEGFRKIMTDQYGMNIITYEKADTALHTLHRTLDPYLSDLKSLVIVGHGDTAAVQSLLNHPSADQWHIHWAKRGAWNPEHTRYVSLNLEQFIKARVRKSV